MEFRIHRGTLYIVIGPMFSGKSTWLNQQLTRLLDQGFKVVKIIHTFDNRPNAVVNSKSGSTHHSSFVDLNSNINIVVTDRLSDLDLSEFHVIGIDEAQFFPDLDQKVRQLVNEGKHVRLAGLCGDAKMQKFGQTLDLIPFADDVKKISASCQICLEELKKSDFKGNILSIQGSFTKKIAGDPSKIVEAGAADMYIPVCRYHHDNI